MSTMKALIRLLFLVILPKLWYLLEAHYVGESMSALSDELSQVRTKKNF
jgi:hypothetical protein